MTPSRPPSDLVSQPLRSRNPDEIHPQTILPDKKFMYYFINDRTKYQLFVTKDFLGEVTTLVIGSGADVLLY